MVTYLWRHWYRSIADIVCHAQPNFQWQYRLEFFQQTLQIFSNKWFFSSSLIPCFKLNPQSADILSCILAISISSYWTPSSLALFCFQGLLNYLLMFPELFLLLLLQTSSSDRSSHQRSKRLAVICEWSATLLPKKLRLISHNCNTSVSHAIYVHVAIPQIHVMYLLLLFVMCMTHLRPFGTDRTAFRLLQTSSKGHHHYDIVTF